MGNKLHIIVHTINGTLVNTYNSWHEDLVADKLPKDIVYPCDINELLHYGSFKVYDGNKKHCFYYKYFNTI